jgi:hypothetical protein
MPQSRSLGLGKRIHDSGELSAPLAAGAVTGAVVSSPPRFSVFALFCVFMDAFLQSTI